MEIGEEFVVFGFGYLGIRIWGILGLEGWKLFLSGGLCLEVIWWRNLVNWLGFGVV